MSPGWRIAAGWLMVCLGLTLSAEGAVKPVVTNKSRFRIPFRFDAAALARMNARELQLYVSSNRGAGWELVQTIGPQNGKFEFQAPADGEYWFAVRTIDGNGAPHPPGPKLDAGLIVIVDSIPPSLVLNLEQPAPGKVQLSWSAHDSQLDVASLKLESLQPGAAVWEPVSVAPTQRGTTTWTLPKSGAVSVRGTIVDLAGNLGQATSELGAANGKPRDPNTPDLRHPIATDPASSERAQGPAIEVTPRTADASLPAPQPNALVPLGPLPPLPTIPAAPKLPLVSQPTNQRPDIVQDRWPAVTTPPEAGPYRATAGRQRVVNSRKFTLAYTVDDVGPSGVGGVDLFITPDQGRRWYRYGEDADRRSPFEVEVPRDGEYGFTVRVKSGAGLAMDPPVPGEPPSIVVLVDQTPPRLEVLPIRQGQGADLNQITIQWRIHDDMPSDKPIALYFAPTLQGPWEPISGWRPDTGSFQWAVGLGSPAQFHVRVMARDAAGNVTQQDTPQPVVVDLTRPSARIVDVELMPTSPR